MRHVMVAHAALPHGWPQTLRIRQPAAPPPPHDDVPKTRKSAPRQKYGLPKLSELPAAVSPDRRNGGSLRLQRPSRKHPMQLYQEIISGASRAAASNAVAGAAGGEAASSSSVAAPAAMTAGITPPVAAPAPSPQDRLHYKFADVTGQTSYPASDALLRPGASSRGRRSLSAIDSGQSKLGRRLFSVQPGVKPRTSCKTTKGSAGDRQASSRPWTHVRVTPQMRARFIPKVVAFVRWRPRLAYRFLPKYISVLDGRCTQFLLRHLVKLQPARSRLNARNQFPLGPAAAPAEAGTSIADGAWPPHAQAQLERLASSLTASTSHDHEWQRASITRAGAIPRALPYLRRRAAALLAQERVDFEVMVHAVCAASVAKLQHYNWPELVGCVSALGDLGIRPSPAYMAAWESATLPYLQQLASLQVQAVSGIPRQGIQQGAVSSSSSGSSSETTPAAFSGLPQAWMLGMLVQGVARAQMQASQPWCMALWQALGAAGGGGVMGVLELGDALQGLAIMSAHHVKGQQGTSQTWLAPASATCAPPPPSSLQPPAAAAAVSSVEAHVPRPPLDILLTLAEAYMHALEAAPQQPNARILLAPCLALAMTGAGPSNSQPGTGIPAADQDRLASLLSWWFVKAARATGATAGILSKLPALHKTSTTGASAPHQLYTSTPGSRSMFNAQQLCMMLEAAAVLQAVMTPKQRPTQAEGSSRKSSFPHFMTPGLLQHLACAALHPTRNVHAPTVVRCVLALGQMTDVANWRPSLAVAAAASRSMEAALHQMKLQEVAACACVLAAWKARPNSAWQAGITVVLHTATRQPSTATSLQDLATIVTACSTMHVALPPGVQCALLCCVATDLQSAQPHQRDAARVLLRKLACLHEADANSDVMALMSALHPAELTALSADLEQA